MQTIRIITCRQHEDKPLGVLMHTQTQLSDEREEKTTFLNTKWQH